MVRARYHPAAYGTNVVNMLKLLFGGLFGTRRPITKGTIQISGPNRDITIRRDRFGVPHINAATDHDAWFGMGFCQGQDRSFQIETLLRVVRGTVSELVGADALPIDRISRRVGFRQIGEATLEALDEDVRLTLEAFTAGAAAGTTDGTKRKAHEFALLRRSPTRLEAADVTGVLALQSFALAANWDVELARLKVLTADGPEAVAALDPTYPEWLPVTTPPRTAAGVAADRLRADLAVFQAATGAGGGSNNWAIAADRTATGRPLLANDPHLAPLLPPHWYLCHVATPEWGLAGAALAGTPAVPAGHNGFAAWGVTAGLVDNTDLYLEEVGPDARSVRRGDRFLACDVRSERIEVKGGKPVTEAVLETDRGPIIGPALDGEPGAISMQGTWMQPGSVRGLLALHHVRSFDEFREAFRDWNALSLNLAYADASGTIGWQLIGAAPRRRSGGGMVPLPAWEPEVGWEQTRVPYDEMPHHQDPPTGFVATANNKPAADGPYLGSDWIDGYRVARIGEQLESRANWDVNSCLELQLDLLSIPWREMRDSVLAAAEARPGLAKPAEILRDWDGVVSAGSSGAALYELFVAELGRRAVAVKAPNSQKWALGIGFTPLVPHSLFAVRRMGLLVSLIDHQPEGWFERGWEAEIGESLAAADRQLRASSTESAWGSVRPLNLLHALGGRKPLDRIFNIGPFPWGGDADTVGQASPDPADVTNGTTIAIASMRMVIDVGAWDLSRFSLPGGQSGNPLSSHYADLLRLWKVGDGAPIAWSEEAVTLSTHKTLRLVAPTR